MEFDWFWVVGWVGFWFQRFYFAMGWVGLGWRNWTHAQLCLRSICTIVKMLACQTIAGRQSLASFVSETVKRAQQNNLHAHPQQGYYGIKLLGEEASIEVINISYTVFFVKSGDRNFRIFDQSCAGSKKLSSSRYARIIYWYLWMTFESTRSCCGPFTAAANSEVRIRVSLNGWTSHFCWKKNQIRRH